MTPSYSVSFDRGRGMLRLTLGGFFDLDTVARFADERDRAVRALGLPPKRHVTLCDIRTQMVSSAPVSAQFQKMIVDPRFASRKLAFVIEGALGRMQLRRTASERGGVGYFTDVAAAEAWLMEPDPAARPLAVPQRRAVDAPVQPRTRESIA